MRKMFAVLKREYLATVRKKMFIFMTLFFPVLMAAITILPGLMMAGSLKGEKVAVIDGTGKLEDAFTKTAKLGRRDLPFQLNIEYVTGVDTKPYLDRLASRDDNSKLDAVLLIPADAFDGPKAKMTFYSRASTDLITEGTLVSSANRAIYRHRLLARGIDPESLDKLTRDVPVDSVQLMRSGEQKKGGQLNFIIGFIFAALLIVPSLITNQEKTGTYWGIRTDITNYAAPSKLRCPEPKTLALAATPPRLATMPNDLQERMMNWGYAVTDAAMRTHVDSALPPPTKFPFALGNG